MTKTKSIGIYVRVSGKRQDIRSQLPDLKRWADAYAGDRPVTWYEDKATGRTMRRPGWEKLAADVRTGKITTIVVWRLDRLGRTASGLTLLFEDLQRKGIGLISLRDGIDLETPAGRLMANVLASVAAYENEVRSERIRAGQAAARAQGKRWGGSKPGVPKKVTQEKRRAIHDLRDNGLAVSAIARTVNLSRPTIYRVLKETTPS